jgi:hypothetical protein
MILRFFIFFSRADHGASTTRVVSRQNQRRWADRSKRGDLTGAARKLDRAPISAATKPPGTVGGTAALRAQRERVREGRGFSRCAGVAQPVEQLIRNQQVRGSNPRASFFLALAAQGFP